MAEILVEHRIIDVRTPEEFVEGHHPGAQNIPFSVLPLRLDELKSETKQIVLCCASGGRSRSAARLLENNDIACVDAGPWQNVAPMLKEGML